MTNKTDENFYCESFYRINSITFFPAVSGLYEKRRDSLSDATPIGSLKCNREHLDGIQKLLVANVFVTWLELVTSMREKDFQMGEIEYYYRNRYVSEKVAAEFLAKVFHPRIRSKRRFAHRRESPDFASILLVLSVLNVG